ncbi:uncharacterized protein [Trachinotus anak]|uniref:uncharacterized protein n=1 Tax=Trachinotus anak TaxID=443729 RepID=UPI0039F2339B
MKTKVKLAILFLLVVGIRVAFVTDKERAKAKDVLFSWVSGVGKRLLSEDLKEHTARLTQSNIPLSPGDFEETHPVEGVNGSDVILPCYPKFISTLTNVNLEWIKGKDEIFTLRDGKYPAGSHRHRASNSSDGKVNASLRLRTVTEEDAGEFFCCILTSENKQKCTNQTLRIVNETRGNGNGKTDPVKGWTTAVPPSVCVSVGVVVGVVVVALAVGFFFFWKKKCPNKQSGNQHGNVV